MGKGKINGSAKFLNKTKLGLPVERTKKRFQLVFLSLLILLIIFPFVNAGTWDVSYNTELKSVFKLDENNGAIAFDKLVSANTTNITLYNTPAWVAGMQNSALNFTYTSNQYGVLSSPATLDGAWNVSKYPTFTISLWYYLYPENDGHNGHHVFRGTDNFFFIVYVDDGANYFNIKTVDGNYNTYSAANLLIKNAWSNIVLQKNGTHVLEYVNGSLKMIKPYTGAQTSIGVIDFARSASSGEYLRGTLDEIYLWNKTLTAADIQTLYDSGAGTFYNPTVNIAPQVYLNLPTNNTNYSGQVTFNCSATDTAGIINVSLYLDGALNYTATNTTTEQLNISFQQTYGLADGTHNYTCNATDAGALIGVNGSYYNFTVDSTPPLVSIVYPTNTTYYTTITQLNYTVSDSGVGTSKCWYNNLTNNYSLQSAGTNFTIVSHEGTANNLTVWCNDTLNNTNSSFVSYTMIVVPNFTITSPANGTYRNINYTYFIFNLNDSSGVDNATFNLYNAVGIYNTTFYNSTYGITNPVSMTLNQTIINMPDGLYIWNITGYDLFNNYNYSESNNLTIDTINPVINILYPINNSNYSSNVAWFNYTYSDANPGYCWYTNNSGTTNYSLQTAGTNFSMSSWEGINNWTLWCNDSANNQNSSFIKFIKDTTYPLISFYTPTLVNNSNASQNWVFANVTVTEANEANISFRLWNSSHVINWSNYTTPIREVNWTGLIDGTYFYNVTVTDIVNDINSTEVRQILLDTISPTVYAILPPSDNGSFNRSWLYTEGNASDLNLNYINITVYFYNKTLATFNYTDDVTQNLKHNFTGMAAGWYTWNVTAKDTSGNSNSTISYLVVLLDVVAPNATIIGPVGGTGGSSGNSGYLYNKSYFGSGNFSNATGNNASFAINVTDDFGVANITFNIYNETGLVNQTTNIYTQVIGGGLVNVVVAFLQQLIDGVYTFYFQIFDFAGNVFNTGNNTITVDTIYPNATIIYPENLTYRDNYTSLTWKTIYFNFTTGNFDSCWYTFDGTKTNISYPPENNKRYFISTAASQSVSTYHQLWGWKIYMYVTQNLTALEIDNSTCNQTNGYVCTSGNCSSPGTIVATAAVTGRYVNFSAPVTLSKNTYYYVMVNSSSSIGAAQRDEIVNTSSEGYSGVFNWTKGVENSGPLPVETQGTGYDIIALWFDKLIVNCNDYNYTTFNVTYNNSHIYNISLFARDLAGNVQKTSVFPSFKYFLYENSSATTRFYNTSVYETDSQNYAINISYDNNFNITSWLVFNSAAYSGNTSNNSFGFAYANATIDVPSTIIEENKSFYWMFNLSNSSVVYTVNTTSSNQYVKNISFEECNTTLTNNHTYLNVSFVDEITLLHFNASIPIFNANYYLGKGSSYVTLADSNVTVLPSYQYCFKPQIKNVFLKNLQVQYGDSPNYFSRDVYYNSLNLTNTSTDLILYGISSSQGIYTSIYMTDLSSNILSNVTIKFISIIEGSQFILTEVTDSSGIGTFWVNPNTIYTVTMSRPGCVDNTVTLRPTQASYSYQLNCGGGVGSNNYTMPLVAPPASIYDGLTFQKSPKTGVIQPGQHNFEFSVRSIVYSISKIRMELYNINRTVIAYAENNITQTNCNESLCYTQLYYTLEDRERITGSYYADFGSGWLLLETDANWYTINSTYSRGNPLTGTIKDLSGIFNTYTDENGFVTDAGNRAEFSRIVFVFLILAVLLAFFNKSTGYDSSNPGAFLVVLAVIIFIASVAGGLNGEGFFYLRDMVPEPVTDGSVVNETSAWLNSTGYILNQTNSSRNPIPVFNISITSVYDNNAHRSLTAGNYSYYNSLLRNASVTNYNNIGVSYDYKYRGATSYMAHFVNNYAVFIYMLIFVMGYWLSVSRRQT